MATAQAIKKEIQLLEEEKKKIEKGKTGMMFTAVIFTILIFPVGIIMFIYIFLRSRKAAKIDDEIRKFERELRMAETSKK